MSARCPWRSLARALAVGALLGCAGRGAADATPADEDPRQDALRTAAAGAFTGAQLATGQAGNSSLGELGARAVGLESAGRRGWLLQWDALLAGTGGYLAAGGPAPLLMGWQGRLEAGAGRRLLPALDWSPYLGAHGRVRVQWLRARHGGSTANDVDFAEGFSAWSGAGLVLGASFLDGDRSLLVLAFAQEARRPTPTSPDATFTEGGLAARLDLGRRLTTSVEASWGMAPARRNAALGSTDTATHEELDATMRLGLPKGTWIEIDGGASRDADRIRFRSTGRSFPTASPPELHAGVGLGVWAWR